MKTELQTIYEDDNFLVVNKPSGIAVHADGRTKEETLSDWVLETHPEMEKIGEPWQNDSGEFIPRPGIVHRIDRETSGVLLLAKNQETFEYLKKQFQERSIRKTYRAFVYGALKEMHGRIEKEIGKSRSDFRKWSAEFGSRGQKREAVTEYDVLLEAKDKSSSYLEVHPKTGRTHQIRVHLKAIGHPVVCDKLYASKKESLFGFDRLALHAFSIAFANREGNLFEFEAPLPEDFMQAIKKIRGE